MSECRCKCKDYTVTFLAFWLVVAPAACGAKDEIAKLTVRVQQLEVKK